MYYDKAIQSGIKHKNRRIISFEGEAKCIRIISKATAPTAASLYTAENCKANRQCDENRKCERLRKVMARIFLALYFEFMRMESNSALLNRRIPDCFSRFGKKPSLS